jgi:hypothetical protein
MRINEFAFLILPFPTILVVPTPQVVSRENHTTGPIAKCELRNAKWRNRSNPIRPRFRIRVPSGCSAFRIGYPEGRRSRSTTLLRDLAMPRTFV